MAATKPFLYTLIPCGEDNQDYLFKRIRGSPADHGSNVWAMHIDTADPNPEQVLVFVQGNVPAAAIHDKLVKAQGYFVRQLQPHIPEDGID